MVSAAEILSASHHPASEYTEPYNALSLLCGARAAWAQETGPTVPRASKGHTADAKHGTPGGTQLTLPCQVCATPRGLLCARAIERSLNGHY